MFKHENNYTLAGLVYVHKDFFFACSNHGSLARTYAYLTVLLIRDRIKKEGEELVITN